MDSFFGAADRKNQAEDGYICSERPAWTQTGLINELDEEISMLERDLEYGSIPGDLRYSARDELKTLKERFEKIVESKPVLDPSIEKRFHEGLENLNANVADSLFTEYDQKKGLAKPHREADLNDFPCIPVSPEIVKWCNLVNYKQGKVPRNQADKARQILCDYFGRDDASREAIRKTTGSSVGRNSVGFVNERFAREHDRIFGKKKQVAEAPKEAVDKHEKRVNDIKEKMDFVESSRAEIKEPVVEKPVKTWKCGECGDVVSTRVKGAHIAKHRVADKKAAKEAERALAEVK